MLEKHLRVNLMRHTEAPETLVALAAKLCYDGCDTEELLEKIAEKDQSAFVRKVMGMGHESVLEHVSFTFLIEGVSRALLAQLTRHRIASFSVKSQRYVSYDEGFGYIVPPKIKELGEEAEDEYAEQMETMQKWYETWQKRLGSNEDARFVLPNACETRLMVTMNARELLHFFALRMCNRAQWEIRELANRMFGLCYEKAPEIFSNAGAGCLRGKCPEGEKTCGMAEEVRKERKLFLSKHSLSHDVQTL